jgi:hypothetical protein
MFCELGLGIVYGVVNPSQADNHLSRYIFILVLEGIQLRAQKSGCVSLDLLG